jgi:hypothetical protein
MMTRIDVNKIDMRKVKAAVSAAPRDAQAATDQAGLSEDDCSKDAFFVQVAEVADAMIVRHGKEFAIGTLVLAAKFIAEGRPLVKRTNEDGEASNAAKPV